MKKKCEKMLLIKTNNSHKNILFEKEIKDFKVVIIIDSLDLVLEKILNN